MPNENEPQTDNPADAAPLPGPSSPPTALSIPSGEPISVEADTKKPAAPSPVGREPHDATAGGSLRNEFASKTNAYLLDYIKFADVKAGAILTFAGLVGGGIASTAPKTLAASTALAPAIGFSAAAVVALTLVFALGVAICCLRAFSPRTPKAASLASFADIAGMKLEEYAAGVAALTTGEATAVEYCKHNWTLSHVAQSKFNAISAATAFVNLMVLTGALYGLLAVAIALPLPW